MSAALKQLALLIALTLAAAAAAHAEEETQKSEAEDGYSWERPEDGIEFSTRIAGRRIPDYVRDLMENAQSLAPDADEGVPPPATLAQLRRRAEEDADAMKEVLRSEAYYNGSVSSSVRQGEGGGFEVVYLVVMGPRTMIRNFIMQYSGHPDGGPGLVESASELGLQPDRAATAGRVIDFTQKAITHLHNNGYPDAKLDRRRVIVDLSASLADITLYITARERYVFGPALVSNEGGRTDPDYVRGLTAFKAGEVYDRSKVDATSEALRKTNLFAGIGISSAGPEDGALPQRIELTEREARTVRLGVKWSSSEGAGVSGSWEHRNLFGRAETLTLALSIAQIEQSATADFRKPRFLREDQSLLASFEIAHEDSDAYKEDRIKTGVSLERVLTPEWTGSLGLTFQLSETEDSNGRISYQLFGVPVTLKYDTADDLLDPKEGIRATLQGTPYFGASDEEPTTFTKLEATGSTYLTPVEELTFAFRGRYGMIAAGDTADVPGSTRFYSGGGGSVRGYGYQMAGPLDASNDPTGGRSVLEANVEVRYRAFEDIGVVAFVDGGQAYDNLTPSLGDPLLWGAGLGLRYYTPIGPVRLDVAVPLNRRDNVDDAFQIYVSLGQAF
ncbi:autotransporter assembly complex protein TamA [Parvibaculum sp.]|uniref:autotransporter assembly complex protein TamA n=1 Tax=Parvibaculum sp. TaxID=2024848 RepID=UPI003BAB7FEF